MKSACFVAPCRGRVAVILLWRRAPRLTRLCAHHAATYWHWRAHTMPILSGERSSAVACARCERLRQLERLDANTERARNGTGR
jgi:hypothetical protein